MGSTAPHVAFEKSKEDTDYLETIPTNLSAIDQEAKKLNAIESLGFEDWQAKKKKIVRKLDMMLLPQLWILYMFNCLNRVNIAQARLDPDFETLQLGNTDYSTAVALLTVGYMLAQLQKLFFGVQLYLPTCALLWSGVCAATADVKNPGELFAVQFVLGIIEAPLFPALLYSGLIFAQTFSGLIAAGVLSGMVGLGGLQGWQWLFILEAALSAFFALTAYWILPNYPHSQTGGQMWSITEDVQRIAVARIEADRVEAHTDSTVWHGLRLALTDVKTYILIFMNIFMTSSYGFNNFFLTMVRGFGIVNNTISLLLIAPPYVLGTAVSFFVAWCSDRKKERGFHIMANSCCAIIGFIILVAILNTVARHTAAFLYTSGSFFANALVYTWEVSSLGQAPEEGAAGGAIVNICGHLGNVMSPYFLPDSDSPRYTMAMILQIMFAGLTLCMAFTSKTYLRRRNKKLKEMSDQMESFYNPFTT